MFLEGGLEMAAAFVCIEPPSKATIQARERPHSNFARHVVMSPGLTIYNMGAGAEGTDKAAKAELAQIRGLRSLPQDIRCKYVTYLHYHHIIHVKPGFTTRNRPLGGIGADVHF